MVERQVTSIKIDRVLWRKWKAKAAEIGIDLGELTENAIKEAYANLTKGST